MTALGVYRPGKTPLHRAGALPKLMGVLVFSTVLVAFRSPLVALSAVLLLTGLYFAAGLGLKVMAEQVWPLRWVLVPLAGFQVWSAGWSTAVAVVGTLVAAAAGAGLVSLTTRVTEVIEAVTRLLSPARGLGVDPERVGLLLALTIRAVPVVAATFAEVRDARRARGLERSPQALVTPIVVRTVRHADRVADALAARGVDD